MLIKQCNACKWGIADFACWRCWCCFYILMLHVVNWIQLMLIIMLDYLSEASAWTVVIHLCTTLLTVSTDDDIMVTHVYHMVLTVPSIDIRVMVNIHQRLWLFSEIKLMGTLLCSRLLTHLLRTSLSSHNYNLHKIEDSIITHMKCTLVYRYHFLKSDW